MHLIFISIFFGTITPTATTGPTGPTPGPTGPAGGGTGPSGGGPTTVVGEPCSKSNRDFLKKNVLFYLI